MLRANKLIPAWIAVLALLLMPLTPAEAVLTNPTASCNVSTCTLTFTAATDYYSWTVPSGITSISFTIAGGGGGNGLGSGTVVGGKGSTFAGALSVSPGDALNLYVGNKGTDATSSTAGVGATNAAGSNGGNGARYSASYVGGGGGAASEIRLNGTLASNRVVVAAAGGGSGAGCSNVNDSGGNALGNNGGAGGPGCGASHSGRGATISAAGGGSNNGGSAGSGGNGGAAIAGGGAGGGGGGGYFGGGGGAAAGGGAGSSWVDGTKVSFTSAFATAASLSAGSLTISYSNVPVDSTPPAFSNSNAFSINENSPINSTVGTISVNESATLTLSGSDSSTFTLTVIDSVSATLRIKISADFEVPVDAGSNNVYNLTITARDSAGNSLAQNLVISIVDIIEIATIESPSLSGSPSKGISVNISVSVGTAGLVRFLLNGKRIAGCVSVPTTGTAPSITAICSWKPTTSGSFRLTAQITPASGTFSAATSVALIVNVGRRTGAR